MDSHYEKAMAMQASQTGVGSLKASLSPRDVKPDTVVGMVQLLDHPISELETIHARLRDISNRLSGPQPEEVPANAMNGQIAGSLLTLFGEKHSHLARLCSAIQREITRLDGAI